MAVPPLGSAGARPCCVSISAWCTLPCMALAGAGAFAVELDINPEWVAEYLYIHHAGGPTAVPVVPGQFGIPGRFLVSYSRNFFTVLAN
jgi:hypothetical protein